MDNQTLIETIEALKKAGFVYNDSDFCRKTGMAKSFLSEMKAGRRVITEQTVQRIRDTFPNFSARRLSRWRPKSIICSESSRNTTCDSTNSQTASSTAWGCRVPKKKRVSERKNVEIKKAPPEGEAKKTKRNAGLPWY